MDGATAITSPVEPELLKCSVPAVVANDSIVAEAEEVESPNDDFDGPLLLRPVPGPVQEAVALYLSSGITHEVSDVLEEAEVSRAALAGEVISAAFDQHDSQRELASVLLADLAHRDLLSASQLQRAFLGLFHQAQEQILDVPELPLFLAKFIARAIADDVIAPSFVTRLKAAAENAAQKQVVQCLENLLQRDHALVRLDEIWGVGGGLKPVRLLKKKIQLLVTEFFSANDFAEAERCVRDLDVPHFHHEIVYEAVTLSIDKGDRAQNQAIALLKYLSDSALITSTQLQAGFLRVFDNIEDMQLDIPTADALIADFASRSVSANLITKELAARCPEVQRGRKRYVSENDGGLVKAR